MEWSKCGEQRAARSEQTWSEAEMEWSKCGGKAAGNEADRVSWRENKVWNNERS